MGSPLPEKSGFPVNFLLAALVPNFIRYHPFLFSCPFVFFVVVKNRGSKSVTDKETRFPSSVVLDFQLVVLVRFSNIRRATVRVL